MHIAFWYQSFFGPSSAAIATTRWASKPCDISSPSESQEGQANGAKGSEGSLRSYGELVAELGRASRFMDNKSSSLHGTSPLNFTALPTLTAPLGPSLSGCAEVALSPEHSDQKSWLSPGMRQPAGSSRGGISTCSPSEAIYFHILLSS